MARLHYRAGARQLLTKKPVPLQLLMLRLLPTGAAGA